MIKKYSEEKRQELIDARKDGTTIVQIADMTERCRMARLRGIKSQVQNSNNPLTSVQQKKN